MSALTVCYCRDHAIVLTDESAVRFYVRTNDHGGTSSGDSVLIDSSWVSSSTVYDTSVSVSTSQNYAANYWTDRNGSAVLSSPVTWTTPSSLSSLSSKFTVSSYNGSISVQMSAWSFASSGSTIYPSFYVYFTSASGGSSSGQLYTYNQLRNGITKTETSGTNYTVEIELAGTYTTLYSTTVYVGNPPVITAFGASAGGADNITVSYAHNGATSLRLYYGTSASSMSSSVSLSTSASSYTLTGLSDQTTYYMYLYAENSYGTATSQTISETTGITRPSNFYWPNSHHSGDACNTFLASEWNDFCDRVNEFRTYKGLATVNFTQAVSGGQFTAAMFNNVRNAIYTMNSSGVPAQVGGVNTWNTYPFTTPSNVTWAIVDQLRTALNAIT